MGRSPTSVRATLLGIPVAIANNYERIHRSNLIETRVLLRQSDEVASVASLGLTDKEPYTTDEIIDAVDGNNDALLILADVRLLPVSYRFDTESEREHYRHGGILPFVLRDLAG